LRVVLVSPRNPLNIGAAARAMSNFGFADLHLVAPYDVAFREARSAVNAHSILEHAEVHATLAEALAGCTLVVGTTSLGNRDLHAPLYRLERAGRLIRQHWESAPVALLFGSEKFGLGNEDLSHCHWYLRIPTREAHGSMNLGQAVAVCLYELRHAVRVPAAGFDAPPQAPAEDLERMTAVLIELLRKSGYVHERTRESNELKIRRLVRRLHLPKHDAEVWLGMLRQILWRLDHPA
jgi:TrmH family RNA methyltransferase